MKTVKKGRISATLPKKPKTKSDHIDIHLTEPAIWKVNVNINADDPIYVPKYQSDGAAAADLVANLDLPVDVAGTPSGAPVERYEDNNVVRIYPQQTVKIDCGFSIAVPENWEAQIRARSGLAFKGLVIPNGIGTLDSDYRGRVCMMLTNASKNIITIKHRERIGQIALKPVYLFDFVPVAELDETARGTGGFGSTGNLA